MGLERDQATTDFAAPKGGFGGSVDSFSLADIFQNLAMNQQSGTLHIYFDAGGNEKFIYFEAGQVRYLSCGQNKALVPPEVFIARGYVNQIQLDEALALQQRTPQPIGACLLELGHVSRKQVDEVVKLQIEEEIFDLFLWKESQFKFEPNDKPDESVFVGQISGNKGPGLAISHLIMEAARRVDEWERLHKQIPNSKEIYYLDLAARNAIAKGEMETDEVEKRVASLLDCARDVEDLIADSALFQFEVLNALSGFIQQLWARTATVAELTAAEQECLKQNLPKRRVKVLERLLALGGENMRVRRELAEALIKDHQVEKACIHFVVLADAEMAAKREDAAVELYKRILSLSPKHLKAHDQLGAYHARRVQKKEAFVHYKELYEAYREQNNPRDARTAAIHALENDPLQVDLRNGLIELLTADNEKDAASQQLEILGDQAAKLGNGKNAADAYRRAMALRPSNAQLKKKLTDVMLTKEDRQARRRRLVTLAIMVLMLSASAGSMAYKEHCNKLAFQAAEAVARPLVKKAEQSESKDEFPDAKRDFELAAREYQSLTDVFSPILQLGAEAKKQIKLLEEKVVETEHKQEIHSRNQAGLAEKALEVVRQALADMRIYDARKKLDAVLRNKFASESVRGEAEKFKAEFEARIAEFERGRKRLGDQPIPPFSGVEEEYEWKRAFIDKFERTQDGEGSPQTFRATSVQLPLQVQTDIEEVNVFFEGRPIGSVGKARTASQNTLRYACGSTSVFFEFKRRGYKTVRLSALEHRSPHYTLIMVREAAVQLFLRPFLDGGKITADPLLEGEIFYLGLNDGRLVQAREGANPVQRQYKLTSTNPLAEEILGQIHVHKRGGRTALVFGSRGGDCTAIYADDFTPAWKESVHANTRLVAGPTAARLASLDATLFVMPTERKLILVNCDNGSVVSAAIPQPDSPAEIVSRATGVEQESLLIAGCQSGKLYGLHLATNSKRNWNTGQQILALRTRPVFYENKVYAGAGNGNIYILDPKKQNDSVAPDVFKTIRVGGVGVGDPLIHKRRMYVGSEGREGVVCFDLDSHQQRGAAFAASGSVVAAPVAVGDILYFVTDKGWLYSYSLDEARSLRWSYQMPRGEPIAGPPLVGADGRRIYIIGKDGTILGFDE